jgi:hypothetical protein
MFAFCGAEVPRSRSIDDLCRASKQVGLVAMVWIDAADAMVRDVAKRGHTALMLVMAMEVHLREVVRHVDFRNGRVSVMRSRALKRQPSRGRAVLDPRLRIADVEALLGLVSLEGRYEVE